MSAFDNSIQGLPYKAGSIHLRRTERKPYPHRDLRAAEGIILATMIGANLLVWGYVAARWFIG